MSYYDSNEHIGLVEAVETLTSIADLEVDGPIAVAEKHEVQLQELPIIYRTVHWLHKKNAERVMHVVRDTYKVILSYLKHFYKREHGRLIKHESIEGIKTIMVLVGEAAKKVDKYTRLFAGQGFESVKQTREFRDLVAFYQRKIVPIAVQESLVKWMQGLSFKSVLAPEKPSPAVLPTPREAEHVFIDLDSVKKDGDYELFFIRKPDGLRFFSPKLLRNIKLVCNFESYIGEHIDEQTLSFEPVQELKVWNDHQFQFIARTILRQNWLVIDRYVKECHKHYNNDLGMMAYRLIIALMLSANQSPALKELSKTSSEYFKDFIYFLRQILSSTDFQRLVTYPPSDPESLQGQILSMVHELCKELFSGFHTSLDANSFINELIVRGRSEIQELKSFGESDRLHLATQMMLDYDCMLHAMHHYGHTPLIRTLQLLQSGQNPFFDNILMQNMPGCIFDLFVKSKRVALLRLPCPTAQEYVHKAHCTEEFKAFIRSLTHVDHGKKHLIINLQDRTGWKEFARCHALEELQKNEEFNKSLVVVSMTKGSEFYTQEGSYQDLNTAEEFITALLEHVASENTGCYYPQKLHKVLFESGFAKKLAQVIHELFFSRKNVLSRHARMDFIELFYLFLQLKVIEAVQPSSLSFTCKDGIDTGIVASAEFFLLLKMINDRPISGPEYEYLKLTLYSSAVLIRGRNLLPDQFNRMNGLTKVLETAIEEKGEKEFHRSVQAKLAPLFDSEILSTVIAIPQPLL